MRRLACLALVACAALVGAGCGDDDATTSAPATTATATATATQTAAGEFTPERDAMAQVEAILVPPPIVDRAEELARAVADAITPAGEGEGENATVTVSTVEEGEPTVILIEVRGLADDSVAGYDLRLTLEPDDTLGWTVATATRRDLCSRGVSGELCA